MVAFILIHGGRYLLQRRDALPHIFFPGHWGLFGGALEPGETAVQALQRELMEEIRIAFDPAGMRFFTRFECDFGIKGEPPIKRTYFEMGPFEETILCRIDLQEGAAAAAFTAREALGSLCLTPHDKFALWMHANRARLRS